jgi:hypothetical protein
MTWLEYIMPPEHDVDLHLVDLGSYISRVRNEGLKDHLLHSQEEGSGSLN